ncbi:MAG: efflux RND transporter permease subunit, partial [Myxococcota bacterium]
VVVENVERHLTEGKSPMQAALISARELLGPVIAMTITLAAVYAPIGFQGGLTGSLFREFALTLAGAVLISGVAALTLSPVMSAKILKVEGKERGFSGLVHRSFDRLRDSYGRLLERTMRGRAAIYTLWVGLSLLGFLMFSLSPTELAPNEDQGVIFGIVDTPSNATIDQLSVYASQANAAMESIPEVVQTFQLTFTDGGFGGAITVPWTERDRTTQEVLNELGPKLGAIPGIRMFAVTPPALPGGGQFPVEVVLASTAESEELLDFAQQLQLKAIESGMFAFPPIIDVKIDRPQVEIVFDREKVAQLGLNMQQVGADIGAAVGGNFVNRFNIDGRSYKVIPQVE